MRTVKFSKKLTNREPSELLMALGAVHGNRAFPSQVFVSKQDYKSIEKATLKESKKNSPWASAHHHKGTVAMHMLNLGPNQSLEDAIKPGYAIVDDEEIAAQLAKSETGFERKAK